MNRSKQKGEAHSSPPASSQAEVGDLVTELTDNDVLFGRGSVGHKGNLQFREIVAGRRDEYMSISKRQQKDWIARQVMSAVAKKGGRFLRRIESLAEAEQFGVPTGKSAWRIVDQPSVLLKVKQALRERDTGQVQKRPTEDQSPKPVKRHQAMQPATSPQFSPGIDFSALDTGASLVMQSPRQTSISSTIPAIGASGAPSTGSLLGTTYERLLQRQLANRQALNILTNALIAPQAAAPTTGQLTDTQATTSIAAFDQEQSRRAGPLTQHRALPNEFLSGVAGQSLPGATSIDTLLALLSSQQGQAGNIPPAAASLLASSILGSQSQQEASRLAREDPHLGTLEAYQAPMQPVSDRLQALLNALQGSSNDIAQSIPGGDSSLPTQQQERIIPRLPAIGDVGDKGDVSPQRAQQPQRLLPAFFPEDLETETKGIVALAESTKLDRKGPGSIYLSFSLTEMLFLSVLCSFGVPSWSPSMLDRGEVFSPIKQPYEDSATSYRVTWYDFGLLLKEAANDWRDHQRRAQAPGGIMGKITLGTYLEDRAVSICASYSTNCRQLAKTTLCVLEKVRLFLEAMREKTTGRSTRVANLSNEDLSSSTSWIQMEVKRWAKTLDCHSANGFPVAYTASDFLVSHPEHKENNAFKLVSHCDQEACEAIWSQIITLSHARSMVIVVSSVGGLSTRLEKSLLNESIEAWEGMPRWWSLNSFYFDVELLKAVLMDGYVGVLSARLSAPSAVASTRSSEPMTFAKLGVASKRLLQERFEQLARLLAKSEENGVFMEQLLQPLNHKCLEERIQAYRSQV